ncbi:MAG TPA: ABC transporter ATP-binding protein, partial [Candidatus Saccharimonadaceae bacterium]|nr:ABC transporter ATP-binding protein [Candidatus Saccharimonadaceae bacterium]
LGDIGGYFGDIMAVRVREQLSGRYYKHLMSLPQKYYDGEVTGKIINRLSRAISEITNFLNFFANNLLEMLLTVIISVGIMAYYSPLLAVLVILLVPVYLLLAKRSSTKWQRLEHEKNRHFDVASGRFAEVVSQMRLVKSFGTEATELEFFDGRIHQMVTLTHEQSRHWHVRNSYRGVLQAIIYAGMFGTIFFQTAHGSLSIGDMVLLITLVNQVTFPLQRMSFFIDMYQRAAANSRDYAEAMQEKPEPDAPGSNQLKITRAKVEYRHVDFAYDDAKDVLHDISFTIQPGTKLALVGESGGGKTTISNLLMQLYQPTSGEILIDSQPIRDVTRASLRQSIATVFQDPALFSGTIRENIAYADPEASDRRIIEAAKTANAYDFVSELPDGFDTEIGERGIKLSGGQKQRIAIARAVLKDAPILILDEATSSLDTKAEREVQIALDRLMKHRTVLIIAHRLSTIAHVDTIVTLEHGHIGEIGTPAALAQSGGIYAELLKLQTTTTESAREMLKTFDIDN